jgi:hypothetical protein
VTRVLADASRGLPWHRCKCGRPLPANVRRCSARTCPEFAPTWARDTRRRLMENLSLAKLTVMFSVTAPGADLYPFDPRFCSHSPSTRCSGRIGCRVDPVLAQAFNRAVGAWWSELHRAAKMRADRATRTKGRLLARVWEKQKRGLAHLHGVLDVSTPEKQAWAKSYVDALRDLAPSKGFGFVDGWAKISSRFWPGVQAGAYLSSYFVTGKGAKASITETVRAGDLPRLVVFVGRDLSSRTYCTMRNLRRARRLWAARSGSCSLPEWSPSELAIVNGLLLSRE